MSRFCEQCGTEVEPDAEFCPDCGEPLAKHDNNNIKIEAEQQLPYVEKKLHSKRRFNVIVLCFIIIIISVLLGCFVVYPNVKQRAEANEVIEMIDSVKIQEITPDSEKNLNKIKKKYNSLSSEQKELITNYQKLEKAYAILETKKDTAIAEKIIEEINKVDVNTLTDTDTSVKSLRDKYDALTDKQKKLVTNSKRLDEYEQVIQARKEEKAKADEAAQAEADSARITAEQQQKVRELIQNFPGFYGTWGDFGAHVDSYQGMLEQAIKSKIRVSDYFDGDPNMVSFEIYPFQMGSGDPYSGAFFLKFEGLNPTGGRYLTLEGLVSVDSSGNLTFMPSNPY